jgi:hypothetical protein
VFSSIHRDEHARDDPAATPLDVKKERVPSTIVASGKTGGDAEVSAVRDDKLVRAQPHSVAPAADLRLDRVVL